MLIRRAATAIAARSRRCYHVLAIESSCDDSSVALIKRAGPGELPILVDHVVETLDHSNVGGIIPTEARRHHQKSIAPLVQSVLARNKIDKPDIVCATRGPGMMGSLSAGLNVAKGLSIAWGVPLVGVHHMLGHLLTPRFFTNGQDPQFPFLSLLASGGHTVLVLSNSVTEHRILADTVDIAIGDMLDKCGRELGLRGTAIGREMESFIDEAPENMAVLPDDVQFPNPLQNQKGRVDFPAFSFAPFISALRRVATKHYSEDLLSLPAESRREIARRLETAIFHHLVSKVQVAVKKHSLSPMDMVLSGGVASNKHLRSKLQNELPDFKCHFVEPKWCTDNALMIGWAGIELYESGLTTDQSALSIAKWPITELLEVEGWLKSDRERPTVFYL